MISDKEARQYILQQLYDEGYRYLARDESAFLYAYKQRPAKQQNMWSDTNYISSCVLLYSFLCFKDIKWVDDSPLSIAKELGIIDWTKVPKDTKVLVWDEPGDKKKKRYFSHYLTQNHAFPFAVYCNGATSWNATDGVVDYKYCELFNEAEEQDHD
jgi:hypothetical protein